MRVVVPDHRDTTISRLLDSPGFFCVRVLRYESDDTPGEISLPEVRFSNEITIRRQQQRIASKICGLRVKVFPPVKTA